MAVIAVLVGLCVVAVVVLAYTVGRLSSQVRQLTTGLAAAERRTADAERAASAQAASHSSSLASLTARVDAELVTAEEALVAAAPVPIENPREGLAVVEDVPVITALPDADDELDITARRVASVTLARPLIRVASLSYGLRHALDDERRFKVRYAVRQEYRRQRKMRRRRRAGRAPSTETRS
jgi:hypothetical protein